MLNHAAFCHVLPAFILDPDPFGCVGVRSTTKSNHQNGQRRDHAGSEHRQSGHSQATQRACGALAFLTSSATTRSAGLGG